MAIAESEVQNLLLEAFPRAQVVLEEELRWNASSYLVVAVFAREAVIAAKEGQEAELVALFQVIERLFVEGDQAMQDLAGAGFLEGLQNHAIQQALDDQFDPDVFLKWLGPASAEAWNGLLTGFKGSPASLAACVEMARAFRDPQSLIKGELQKQARIARRRNKRKG